MYSSTQCSPATASASCRPPVPTAPSLQTLRRALPTALEAKKDGAARPPAIRSHRAASKMAPRVPAVGPQVPQYILAFGQ